MDVDVSYLDSASWDERMPARMKWLRENDPVHWSEPDQLWVLSRFEEVAAVSKNQALFSSAEGVRPGNPAPAAGRPELAPASEQFATAGRLEDN